MVSHERENSEHYHGNSQDITNVNRIVAWCYSFTGNNLLYLACYTVILQLEISQKTEEYSVPGFSTYKS